MWSVTVVSPACVWPGAGGGRTSSVSGPQGSWPVTEGRAAAGPRGDQGSRAHKMHRNQAGGSTGQGWHLLAWVVARKMTEESPLEPNLVIVGADGLAGSGSGGTLEGVFGAVASGTCVKTTGGGREARLSLGCLSFPSSSHQAPRGSGERGPSKIPESKTRAVQAAGESHRIAAHRLALGG